MADHHFANNAFDLQERQKRAQIVDLYLEKHFPNPPMPIDYEDAYTLLIAVLLSARCTDAKVNQITPHLFKIAKTPQAMASLTADQVREIIRPCGLSPAKSKAIVELSKILVEQYKAQVPADFEALEQLPGVGHKTASVVMMHAFNVPSFPIDTHIHRLAQMWGLTDGRSVKQTEVDLKSLFPSSRWNRLCMQMGQYGRECCKAPGCNRLRSPLCQLCFPNNQIAFKSRR